MLLRNVVEDVDCVVWLEDDGNGDDDCCMTVFDDVGIVVVGVDVDVADDDDNDVDFDDEII